MSSSSKRAAPKNPGHASSPLTTALLIVGAVGISFYLLIVRGQVGWPPHQLLEGLATVAGCLALIGPIVLARAQAGEGGLGELLWMTGGLVVWVFDGVGAAQGNWKTISWATPLDARTMGLLMLAVLLAGWRCRLAGRNWSWTNVIGWVLGLFWVSLAIATWVPARALGTTLR